MTSALDERLAQAREAAKTSALNALSAVAEVLGSLDRVTRIVKVVGFGASDPGFTAQPSVINGASEVLGAIFSDTGVHARSAVGVAVLPFDSPVEVELVVEFSSSTTTGSRNRPQRNGNQHVRTDHRRPRPRRIRRVRELVGCHPAAG